ncbi:hypothetical protein BDP27DRAFT_1485853, partial [Rhodocollybia butyracea]
AQHQGKPTAPSTAGEPEQPIVTILDKTGAFLGAFISRSEPEPEEQDMLTEIIFRQGLNDEAVPTPEYKGKLVEKLDDLKESKIYLKITNYRFCKPACFVWIARHLYVGISPDALVYDHKGQGPVFKGFEGQQGRPVPSPHWNDRWMIMMQKEWDKLVREVNEEFMAPRKKYISS